MQYDPIKDLLNKFISKNKHYRKLFYFFLDLFILRQWYVKKSIKKYYAQIKDTDCSPCEKKNRARKVSSKSNAKKQYCRYFDPMGLKKRVFYDAGAGFCQYSDFVLEKYPDMDVIAVDLKIDFLKSYANSSKNNKRFYYTKRDLCSRTSNVLLPAKGIRKADIIVAIDILEHIKDDMSVLMNFYYLIKTKGYLIISTPSNFCTESGKTKEHVRPGYSASELMQKVTAAGFKVVFWQYTYGFWGEIHWKLIMKNSIKMINLSKTFTLLLPFYLLVVFVPSLICMCLDILLPKKHGNGLLMIATKT